MIVEALIPNDLLPIAEKVARAERLSEADALALFQHPDLNAVGHLANHVREEKNGNLATYVLNRYINYSNQCILSCQFCAFSAKRNDTHRFELSIEQICDKTRTALADGITEIHMVGGLHPKLPAEWYLELLRAMQALDPKLHIKAFTAVEIQHLSQRVFKKPLRETLELLRDAGLGSLTGGGAEIFDQGVRDQICRGKETADEWLEIHRTWHKMGMRSSCTMLFGHVETLAQRVDHLSRLRGLQDETVGFTGFIPFPFVPDLTTRELAHIRPTGSMDELRTLAVARLFLDNFQHITAYWIAIGLPTAQIALGYGVDDLHGTIREELIFHMAGSKTPQEQTVYNLEKVIREAGREPRQRNTFYETIEFTSAPEARQAPSPRLAPAAAVS